MDSIEPAVRSSRVRYSSVGSGAIGAGAQLAAAAYSDGGGGGAGITTARFLFFPVGLDDDASASSASGARFPGACVARTPSDASNWIDAPGAIDVGTPSASAADSPASRFVGVGSGAENHPENQPPPDSAAGFVSVRGFAFAAVAGFAGSTAGALDPQLHHDDAVADAPDAFASPARSAASASSRSLDVSMPSSSLCVSSLSSLSATTKSRISPTTRTAFGPTRMVSPGSGASTPAGSTDDATSVFFPRSPSQYRNTARLPAGFTSVPRTSSPSVSSAHVSPPMWKHHTDHARTDDAPRSRRRNRPVFSVSALCRLGFSPARDRPASRGATASFTEATSVSVVRFAAAAASATPARTRVSSASTCLYVSYAREASAKLPAAPNMMPPRRAPRPARPYRGPRLTRCPAPRASRVTAPARNALVRIRGGRSRTRECGRRALPRDVVHYSLGIHA